MGVLWSGWLEGACEKVMLFALACADGKRARTCENGARHTVKHSPVLSVTGGMPRVAQSDPTRRAKTTRTRKPAHGDV